MPLPFLPGKTEDPPCFSATDFVNLRLSRGELRVLLPLDRVIFTYQPALLRAVRRRHRLQKVKGFFGDTCLVKDSGRRTAILANFGIGAPVTVALLEQFAALGAQEFILVGMAGGLGQGLQAGDLVVCESAIRDEGTSYHYLEPARYAQASSRLIKGIELFLDASGKPYHTGSSWTTDAPFRETAAEVDEYRKEGVLAVEMEAAAVFSAGQRLGVRTAAVFAIGDSLLDRSSDGLYWKLDFDFQQTLHGLEILAEAALHAEAT